MADGELYTTSKYRNKIFILFSVCLMALNFRRTGNRIGC